MESYAKPNQNNSDDDDVDVRNGEIGWVVLDRVFLFLLLLLFLCFFAYGCERK